MIDERNFFDQTVKNNWRTYDNMSSWWLHNWMFTRLFIFQKVDCKRLSKLRKLDVDLKAIPQINFTGNLKNNAAILFITEETKATVLRFSKVTVKVLWFYFDFI